MTLYAVKLTNGTDTDTMTKFGENKAEARSKAIETFAEEYQPNEQEITVEGVAKTHCKHCGSMADGERIEVGGSDTIPTYECPDCEEAYCVSCRCVTPEEHSTAS